MCGQRKQQNGHTSVCRIYSVDARGEGVDGILDADDKFDGEDGSHEVRYKFAVRAIAFRLDESGNYFMKLTHTSCSAGANLNLSGKYVFLMFNSIWFRFHVTT